MSERMKRLESGLTGQRRMQTYEDVDALAAQIDEIPGIAGVRLWDIPFLAEIYDEEMLPFPGAHLTLRHPEGSFDQRVMVSDAKGRQDMCRTSETRH